MIFVKIESIGIETDLKEKTEIDTPKNERETIMYI